MKRRTLQHICWDTDIATAKREGTKVKAQCGEFIYPMTEMKPEIPTCTPCSRVVLAEFARLKRSAPSASAFRWTLADGGAA